MLTPDEQKGALKALSTCDGRFKNVGFDASHARRAPDRDHHWRRGCGHAAKSKPDVVLCDLNMPGVDGFQFIEQLAARGYKGGGTGLWHVGSGGRISRTDGTVPPPEGARHRRKAGLRRTFGRGTGAGVIYVSRSKPEIAMPNVFIEPTDGGYQIEFSDKAPTGPFTTQQEAIDAARKLGHHPLVARVRHLNDKAKPDQWRAA